MEKNKSDYWEKRIASRIWDTYNSLEEKNIKLIEFYQEASRKIRNELYDLAEQLKSDGTLSRSEMYRQQHLQKLEAKYRRIAYELAQQAEEFTSDNIEDGIKNVYENTSVVLNTPEFSMPNKKLMEKLIQEPWRNGNFSSRLWGNQKELVRALNSVLTIGIQQGKSVTEMAISLNYIMGKGFNAAHRLVRTETMHCLNSAVLQSYKDRGITKVQFWAAKDERTCPLCGTMHGKIYDIDEAPVLPLHPNCRCTYLPVFEDIEDNISEKGNYSTDVKRIGNNKVNLDYIKSDGFRRKFNKITNNTAVNEALRQYATAMLTHRNGTNGEDLYIIDAKTGKRILRKITGTNELEVTLTKNETQMLREKFFGQSIGIHNHPTNIYPTGSDFGAAGYRGYKFGVVVTHDGRVFKYGAGSKPFLPMLLDERIDKYMDEPYNMSIEAAHDTVLKDFEREYGITWEELK